MDTRIEEILQKDGKDWTREERYIIHEAVKKYGRSILKSRRESLNGE